MTQSAQQAEHGESTPDEHLAQWGLSVKTIHDAMRRGFQRSLDRSRLAPSIAPAMDVYADGFEDLARILTERGWERVEDANQPRLIHPGELVTVALTSAQNVGDPKVAPITRSKGRMTRELLAPRAAAPLFSLEEYPCGGAQPPAYFVVYERSENSLLLEFARPSHMDESGCVDEWVNRIILPPLTLDDGAFDDADAVAESEVPVEQHG